MALSCLMPTFSTFYYRRVIFLKNCVKHNWKYTKKLLFIRTEPIGKIRPKISVADEFSVRGVRVRINSTINIACPAMAYPAPIFRWDNFVFPSSSIVLKMTSTIFEFIVVVQILCMKTCLIAIKRWKVTLRNILCQHSGWNIKRQTIGTLT